MKKRSSVIHKKALKLIASSAVSISVLVIPAIAQADQIDGEWAITSSGSGTISVSGGSGVVISPANFGSGGCPHPSGEVVWSGIIPISSINYTGYHQYITTDDCSPAGLGVAYWTMSDSDHMTACSTNPETGATGCSELTRTTVSDSPGDPGNGSGSDSGNQGNQQPDSDWPKFDYFDLLKQRIYDIIKDNKNKSAKVNYSVNEGSSVSMRLTLKYGKNAVAGSRYKAENVVAGAHSAKFRFSRQERKSLRRFGRRARHKNRVLKAVLKTTATDASGNHGSTVKTWKLKRF